jgi:Transposase DNA-binding
MRDTQFLDSIERAEGEFWGANLGDSRREKRLIKVAEALAVDPRGSLNGCMRNWSELITAYRLLNSPAVSLENVTQPHRRRILPD